MSENKFTFNDEKNEIQKMYEIVKEWEYKYEDDSQKTFSSSEMEKNQYGVCFDFVNYLYQNLKKYNPDCYFFIPSDNSDHYMTHTVIIFPDNMLVECAFKKHIQLKTYTTLGEILNTVAKYLYDEESDPKLGLQYSVYKYTPDNKKYLISDNSYFNDFVSKEGVDITEKYIGKYIGKSICDTRKHLTPEDVREIVLLKYNTMETKRKYDKLKKVSNYNDIPYDIKDEIIDIMIGCCYTYTNYFINSSNQIIGFVGGTLYGEDVDKVTLKSLINVYKELQLSVNKKNITINLEATISQAKAQKYNLITQITGIKKYSYLDLLFISDKEQGKGLGKKLFFKFINASQKYPIFLYTSSLMDYQFYERMGCTMIYERITKSKRSFIFAYSNDKKEMEKLKTYKKLETDNI
jgi:hypothetical protein